mmetsp:Transcript_5560/g.5744  ORF Transcript_5560/g.5744 Transcript_5560/m.5744 type:complete len:522 (-) Transcript_5560:124-1689(-)|eukprot:CAMPEP_0182422100 /NCGR_PEP_ID=MMETSP1167-20130531/7689_1 /TAXON_ID=2988 /ORGANISM="Mallomonas Sp, Strain CCMP3275" /LENGTH=521 /DNA_ID=CAMNT_0024599851 /DNA_START=72 /DNA_END=1637 /DNA_ORIENTATION=+
MYHRIFAITLALAFNCSKAEIIPYRRDVIFPMRPSYLSIPKYSARDAPNWSPGKGQSYIDMSQITLSLACSSSPVGSTSPSVCKNTTIEILVFESPSEGSHWMSYWPSSDTFCCTEEMVEKNKCLSEDRNGLIIPPLLPNAFDTTYNIIDNKVTTLSQGALAHMKIKNTAVYVFLLSVCDPDGSPITIDGPMEIMNPYGYLPADLFGNLPFYGAISCAYLIVGVAWLILLYAYSSEILPLQLWITAVLGLGLIETTLLFAHYLNWNDAGIPSAAITVVGLIFGVSKRAVSRALVLMVSMGYGVVRPSLGEDLKKVLYLCGGYYTLSVVFTLASNVPAKSQIVGDPEFSDLLSLVVFMLAMVDTIFYVWILTSLNNLIISLRSRQQMVKLALYTKFRIILFLSLLFSCSWAMYSMIVYYGDKFEKNWKQRWTTDALYEISYFIILVAIAVLWAPSRNSQRYAYHVELSQFDDSERDEKDGTGITYDNDGLDAEYGGSLANEDENPFTGTGALDTTAALMKKA